MPVPLSFAVRCYAIPARPLLFQQILSVVRERFRECVRKMAPLKSAERIERPLQEKRG